MESQLYIEILTRENIGAYWVRVACIHKISKWKTTLLTNKMGPKPNPKEERESDPLV